MFMVSPPPFTPKPVSKDKMTRLELAYEHYANLILAHIKMVQKDIQTDIADAYEITGMDVVYMSKYGAEAYKVEDIKLEN